VFKRFMLWAQILSAKRRLRHIMCEISSKEHAASGLMPGSVESTDWSKKIGRLRSQSQVVCEEIHELEQELRHP